MARLGLVNVQDAMLGTQRKLMAFRKLGQSFVFLEITMLYGLNCKKCQHRNIQFQISEVREALVMEGETGLYLSMRMLARSWSITPGLTCKTNCFCPISCNPIAMSGSEAHLCSLWLTYSVSRSNRSKET